MVFEREGGVISKSQSSGFYYFFFLQNPQCLLFAVKESNSQERRYIYINTPKKTIISEFFLFWKDQITTLSAFLHPGLFSGPLP